MKRTLTASHWPCACVLECGASAPLFGYSEFTNVVATGLWPVDLDTAFHTSEDGPQLRKLSRGSGRGYRSLMTKRNFGRRPPRLGRLFSFRPLYFVTFCTHKRAPGLDRPEIHGAFIRFAARAARDFNIAVGRYVIMPDHIHLFVCGGPDFVLGRWVGILKQSLAKTKELIGAKSQIWQEGFFDHVLRNDESYAQKWEYVRQNPVRAGLVKLAEDWPYQGEIISIDRA